MDLATPTFGSAIASLFFILNAVGNIPLFVGLLGKYDEKKRQKIIIREMLIALGILILFTLFGESALAALSINPSIIRISGGLLLVFISLSMIFPSPNKEENPHHEPMVVPLATPSIAGPGCITSVMVFASLPEIGPSLTATAIFIAWIPSIVILLFASRLMNYLGEKGLMACERFGGMIVSLIAIKMLATGMLDCVKDYFHIIIPS